MFWKLDVYILRLKGGEDGSIQFAKYVLFGIPANGLRSRKQVTVIVIYPRQNP
jgi:hypothetical protein